MSLNGVIQNTSAYPQWKADFMSPMEGLVRNGLHTRKQPWTVTISGLPCEVRVPLYGMRHVDAVAFYCIIHLGAERWLLELGQGFPLSIYPSIAEIVDESLLPQALRQAIMELLLTPLLEDFGSFMEMHLTCDVFGVHNGLVEGVVSHGADMNADARTTIEAMKKQAHCILPIMLSVPNAGHVAARTVPCAVYLTGQASISHLYQKISGLEPNIHDISALSVPVSIEAGTMILTAAELASLQPDDILLPNAYPARDGRLTLRMSQCAMSCVLQQGNAVVEAIIPLNSDAPHTVQTEDQGEKPVSAEQNQAMEAVHVASLDVTVTFELERRTMTLGELSMVSPGYTFALGVDALAPLTLRVGDKILGTGRLVDLAGTMGVQITSLADNATVRSPIMTTAVGVGPENPANSESTEKKAVRGLASFKQEQAEGVSAVNEARSGAFV